MMMKSIVTLKTAYAAALIIAAASGSALAFAGSANAQDAAAPQAPKPNVKLSSVAMVERTETAEDGSEKITLKDPSKVIVTPGDRVVFTLTYFNGGNEPATAFRATNPLPAAVRFISVAEDWAEVSVDGGKTWGRLDALTVTEQATAAEDVATGDGDTQANETAAAETITRAAEERDVTHVRWVFKDAIPPNGEGSISFRGVVK